MSKSVIISIFAALILGAFIGLLNLESDEPIPISDNQVWTSFETKKEPIVISDGIEAILESGLIYLNITKIEDDNGDEEKLQDKIPEFPTVRSFSIIDNVPRIHLMSKSAGSIAAREGDELPSGWKLKSLNNKRVVAVYGDMERTIAITAYGSDENDNSHKP